MLSVIPLSSSYFVGCIAWLQISSKLFSYAQETTALPLSLRLLPLTGRNEVSAMFVAKSATTCQWTPDMFSFLRPILTAGEEEAASSAFILSSRKPVDLGNPFVSGAGIFSRAVGLLDYDLRNLTMVAYTPLVFKATGLNCGPIRMNEQYEWLLYSLDTFDSGEATLWSDSRTSACGISSDLFLGGHCKFGPNVTPSRSYKDLPSHNFIRITARVHFFDRWLGETLVFAADQLPRWSRAHRWCTEVITTECIKHGIDSCGKTFPDR